MKRSEMIKILKKRRKEYIDCCKKVDYNKLLEIIVEILNLEIEDE